MAIQTFDEKTIPADYVYFDELGSPDASLESSDAPKVNAEGRAIDSVLGPWTRVGARTTLSEVWFGRYSYIVNDASITYARIGNFCSIARDTRLNPGNHPMWRAAQHHFSYRAKSYELADSDDEEFFAWRRADQVTLGHDVWLGHGATVLAGVKIGTGAVIGAGAVVSKDVPDYTIVGGVPAKTIRQRFPEKIQEGLLKLAWWDWSHEKLSASLDDFRNLRADEFLEKYL